MKTLLAVASFTLLLSASASAQKFDKSPRKTERSMTRIDDVPLPVNLTYDLKFWKAGSVAYIYMNRTKKTERYDFDSEVRALHISEPVGHGDSIYVKFYSNGVGDALIYLGGKKIYKKLFKRGDSAVFAWRLK